MKYNHAEFSLNSNRAEIAREVGFCARTIRQDRAWLRSEGKLVGRSTEKRREAERAGGE